MMSIHAFTVLPLVIAAGTFAVSGAPEGMTEPELAVTDASDPPRDLYDVGRCLGAQFSGEEPEFRAYCLAKCEGDEVYTVISRKRKIKNKAHWCEYMAKEFCIQRDEDYDDWCWGVPREDEDDD